MDKIFINICEESLWISTPQTYLKSYKNLYEKYNISTYVYYIWEKESNEDFNFLKVFSCKDDNILKLKIQEAYTQYNVVFINTFTEWLIELTNTIKKNLWEDITMHHESFRDKSLQREYLQNYNPDLWIKYLHKKFWEVDADQVENYLWYPYIVKPSSWIQSAGVAVIQSKQELQEYLKKYDIFLDKFKARWFTNSDLVFEEFIDWVMYSVDYYVSQKWDYITSQPVHVWLGEEIEIDDFMNYVRSFRGSKINDIDQRHLSNLIQWSINALGIKNTYIHHEFKLTSKWELKTIEINGRIWGYRLEMIQESFNFNWLSCTMWESPSIDIKNNFSSFLIYPDKKCILKWFNTDIFSEIKKLKSTYFINKIEKFIGQEIGLTSQWFTKVAIIKIKNSDTYQFEQDYSFIQNNFKNLLVVE